MPVCSVCDPSRPASGPCPQCGQPATDPGDGADSLGFAATGEPASRSRSKRQRLPKAEAWQAVVGERGRGRYLRRFEALQRPGALPLGWHWPAFLCTSGWLLYRKMWGWAALYLMTLALLFVGERHAAANAGRLWAAIDGFALLSILVCWVAPGLLADRLYLAHCDGVIRRIRRDMPRHKYVARLAARGGTSPGSAAMVAVVAGFAVMGVVTGLVVAVAAEVERRETVVEALRIGAGARAAVAAFVSRQGTVPATFREAGFTLPALPPHVASVEIDPRTGTIDIATQLPDVEPGMIQLVPFLDERQRVVWSCRADPWVEAFAPPSCRTAE